MKRGNRWWVLAMLVGVAWPGLVMGEPDPAKVQRLMDRYIQQEEAEKKAAEKPTVDHDLIAWQSAEKCGTAACFEVYLEDYPKGRYAKMARARLKPVPGAQPEPKSRPVVATEKPVRVARPNQRFTDNDDGTVTDNRTGLIWLKDANCFDKEDWSTAMDLAKRLKNRQCGLRDGSVAGQWRLPSKKEWEALVDKTANDPALPAGHPFVFVQSDYYWSSTTYTSNNAANESQAPWLRTPTNRYAWVAYLKAGLVTAYGQPDRYYVWPVRDGR